jgi:hypothetical protein
MPDLNGVECREMLIEKTVRSDFPGSRDFKPLSAVTLGVSLMTHEINPLNISSTYVVLEVMVTLLQLL